MGLIILTLLGLKYLPGWVKLVWLFQQVLQPLRAYHQVMQVRGMGSEHTVFALEQFSLAEDKQLEVTLYERNGGRTLTFYVTAEDLQLAKKIDNLKLKW